MTMFCDPYGVTALYVCDECGKSDYGQGVPVLFRYDETWIGVIDDGGQRLRHYCPAHRQGPFNPGHEIEFFNVEADRPSLTAIQGGVS